MSYDVPKNLIFAHFFFIDIIGSSNPEISTNTQMIKLEILNKIISESKTFSSVNSNDILFQSTGDGAAIGFLRGTSNPIELAKEIHVQLFRYNQNLPKKEKIFVRIGCHSGEVFTITDVYGNLNIWGPGIIMTKRIMDLADKNHILVSSTMAESLFELSENYKKVLHPLNDFEFKHDEVLLIYSFFGDGFGNSDVPLGTIPQKIRELENSDHTTQMVFENLEFDIFLKDITSNLIKIKRIYCIKNDLSTTPVYTITFSIMDHAANNFGKLNLKAYDDEQNELKIQSVIDAITSKEFVLKLNHPITNKNTSQCTIEYDLETSKSFFENIFLLDSKNLTVRFHFTDGDRISEPSLYLLRYENRNKDKIDSISKIDRGLNIYYVWKVNNGIKSNDMLRLEW